MGYLLGISLVLAAVLTTQLVRWFRRRINRAILRSESASRDSDWALKILLQPMLILLEWGIWIATFIYGTDQFSLTRDWRYRGFNFLSAAITNPIFKLDKANYSILDSLKILVLVIALWNGIRIVIELIRSRLLKSFGANRETQNAIALALQFMLMGIGLILILQGLGFDISSLAILASVLGVGVGFGLQNIANNFISGLIILLERQIRVGDFIKFGELMGTVEHIGVRSTQVQTLDHITIIVPNAELVQTNVVNWSHGNPVTRLNIPFGVAYGSNIRKVRETVFEAAQVHPDVLRYPQPQIWFEGFGDNSLNFKLFISIRDPRQQFRTRSDLYYLIEANFRRCHIDIPFPQRDLNLRSSQIDELITLWKNQHPELSVDQTQQDLELMHPSSLDQAQDHLTISDSGVPQSNAKDLLEELIDSSILIRQEGKFTDLEVDALVIQMQGADGVEIKDRRHGLQSFKRCFVGNEVVNWLVRNQKATREEAVRIGRMLIEKGIIHHVTDDHNFEDQFLFYRFYEDEPDSS